MKKKRGISLIVLIVTIIVMIVIAGAIIISLTQTNIIDQAESAKDKYNLSQVKESVELERYNALLSRYDTAENVNISVKELLGLTDTDAMNIISAVTMPENIQTGKYYRLDVTRYGLVDTGAIENNTIKGIYVINDNYDIYYVIEGTISEIEREINDARVIEIITPLVLNSNAPNEEELQALKEEFHIETEVNTFLDLAFTFQLESSGDKICMYVYPKDRMYIYNGEKIIYADKTVVSEEYQYASVIAKARNEIKDIFKEKTATELMGQYSTSELATYVVNNTDYIKEVEFIYSDDAIGIEKLVIEVNEVDFDICDMNSVIIVANDGIYADIAIGAGN